MQKYQRQFQIKLDESSRTECVPFKYLFWNANHDSVAKLMVSIMSGVYLCTDYMLKCVKLRQRQQIPKTYNNIKVEFLGL